MLEVEDAGGFVDHAQDHPLFGLRRIDGRSLRRAPENLSRLRADSSRLRSVVPVETQPAFAPGGAASDDVPDARRRLEAIPVRTFHGLADFGDHVEADLVE